MKLVLRKISVFLLAGVMAASVICMPVLADETVPEVIEEAEVQVEEPAVEETTPAVTETADDSAVLQSADTSEEPADPEETTDAVQTEPEDPEPADTSAEAAEEVQGDETTDPAEVEVTEEEPEVLPEEAAEEPEALPENEPVAQPTAAEPVEETVEEPEAAAPEAVSEEVTEETAAEQAEEEKPEEKEEATEEETKEETEEEFVEISEEFSDSEVMYEYLNMDSDSLLSEYIASIDDGSSIYIEPLFASSYYNGNKLTDAKKEIYDSLAAVVEQVALGNNTMPSISFTYSIPDTEMEKNKYTASELGVESLYSDETQAHPNQEAAKALAKIAFADIYSELGVVIKALIRDCPYDLFWFGNGYDWTINYSAVVNRTSSAEPYMYLKGATVTGVKLHVSVDYRGSTKYTTDSSKIKAINYAILNAKNIVEKYDSLSDIDKINAYRSEIMNLVSYNYSVGGSTQYGNPWQIIYVFDGDNSTNVVCEGYAKAFQYLCDLSNFSGVVQAWYSVSGTFQSGNADPGKHLWNIVKKNDGKNYLVDITNCDVRGDAGLFMVQPREGNVNDGYKVVAGNTTYTYKYSSDSRLIYSDAELALSPVHEWDAGTITSQPTCSKPGIKTYKCKLCSETKTEEFGPLKAHTVVNDPAVAATCTTSGKTVGSHCSVCGTVITAQTTIPAKGHTKQVLVPAVAPTLFSTGRTEGSTCTVCGTAVSVSTVLPMQELTRVLQRGMWGEDVRQVQEKLIQLGFLNDAADGGFGAKTEAAVNAFQAAKGLSYPDGMVGNWTMGKLREASGESGNSGSGNSGSSTGKLTISHTLRVGDTGDEVLAVQKRLKELGYLDATPDGIYGNKTKAAVDEFQLTNNLGYCDGMVGNWTISKLNGNPIPKNGSNSGGSDNSGSSTGKLTISHTLRVGDTGDEVLAVQKRLYELGYLTATPDGIYGNKTKAAVDEFQRRNGLGYCDGKVGNWTIGKLNGNPIPKNGSNSGSSTGYLTISHTLRVGDTGDEVLAVQKRLAELGYLTATPDGIYGNKTKAAVDEFQLKNNLGYCDGMVGNWTIGKLNGNPIAK